jgi:CRISPR-associated endonuclease Csn1
LRDALEKGVWLLDKKGNRINQIRRIRCYAIAGRGTLKYETALSIKKHDFSSNKEYKKNILSMNKDNVYCLFYEGKVKGQLKREFKIVSPYDLSILNCNSISELKNENYFSTCELKDGSTISLKGVIKKGTKVIPYDKTINELTDLDTVMLNERVYKVYKFNLMGTPNIYLQNHIEARQDKDIEKALTQIDIIINPMRYKLKADKFNFAIEGVDFEVKLDGRVDFNF